MAQVQPHQRRWPASLAVAVIIALQLLLPPAIRLGGGYVVPALEALLLAPVVIANPLLLTRDHPVLRRIAILLAYAMVLANGLTLALLLAAMVRGTHLTAGNLVAAAAVIMSTNVVAAGLLFWELDRGGPFARDPAQERDEDRADLLFPQTPYGEPLTAWRPGFLDYLYVGFTNSTAFSPTDTMPLTARAKVVFMMTSIVAVLCIALVAGRAANLF